MVTNGIWDELASRVDEFIFANDIALDITKNLRLAIRATNKLQALVVEKGLSFLPNKTVQMEFVQKNKTKKTAKNFLKTRSSLYRVSTKFLGMTWDS